ncbi:hypothetical protein [Pseudomonas sichuanensis]|uniref:hypothetical protein n=1 Tax=Pseudomonas sichuanensis TaxID=2213015 RepID=UPI003CC5DFC5
MKERPILFSGPMVRAILDDRKTVTRRPLKAWQQPSQQEDGTWFATAQRHPRWGFGVSGADAPSCAAELESCGVCPYGRPGDRLWVRETFMDLRGTGVEHRPDPAGPLQRYAYAAEVRPGSFADDTRKDMGLKWRPSIHMPRTACRLLLEITAVRVERLQAISTEQALAEGIMFTDFGLRERPGQVSLDGGKTFQALPPKQAPGWHAGDATHPDRCMDTPYGAFANLWARTGGDWAGNPWVWVVEFKRIEP